MRAANKNFFFRLRFGLKIKRILNRQRNKSEFIRQCILRRERRFAKRWETRDKVQNIKDILIESRNRGDIPLEIANGLCKMINEVLINLEYEL